MPEPFIPAEATRIEMRKKLVFSVVFSVLLAMPIFLVAAGAAVEFSADMVIVPKGDEPVKGKIFVKGDKIRQETTEEDETQIMIIRPDKKVTWMITPEEKTYMEMPYQSSDKTFEEWTAEKEKNAKPLGEETVSGMPCKKFEVVEDGEKTIFWLSKQFAFPIKVEDSDVTMEYKNIKLGTLDDSLFELPAGYERMTAPIVPPND
jgi:outer membrane lipoprotein-sorting protein